MSINLPPWPGAQSLTLAETDALLFNLNAAGGQGYNSNGNGNSGIGDLSGLLAGGGQWNLSDYRTTADYQRLFDECPPLSSIIAKLATAFANGLFETVDPKTDNYLKGKYKEWDTLWENPNYLQTRAEFMNQLYMNLAIWGWCYAVKVYPAGFENTGTAPSAIWLLPPWCVEVELKQRNFLKLSKGEAIRKVFFNSGEGQREELDEANLILFTDAGCVVDPDTLLPKGRISRLGAPIGILMGAYESQTTVMKNRGATGILSNEPADGAGVLPMNQDEKARLNRQYNQGYGLQRNKNQIIITDAALKWQSMVMNVKELGLSEAHLSAVKDITDAFNSPMALSSHTEHSAEANITTAYASMYTDNIIPTANALVEQLTKALQVAGTVKFIVSYEHISHLQKSEKEKGEGMKALGEALTVLIDANLITPNMALIELGRDTVALPEFDQYKFEKVPEQLDPNNPNGTNPTADTTTDPTGNADPNAGKTDETKPGAGEGK